VRRLLTETGFKIVAERIPILGEDTVLLNKILKCKQPRRFAEFILNISYGFLAEKV